MSKSDIWYGFLEAGTQSTAVVRDAALETRNPKTVFLYNHTRGRFLEYAREIVEPKLRELTPDDIPMKELQSAFKAARKAFSSNKVARKWEADVPAAPARKPQAVAEEDFPMDDDLGEEF